MGGDLPRRFLLKIGFLLGFVKLTVVIFLASTSTGLPLSPSHTAGSRTPRRAGGASRDDRTRKRVHLCYLTVALQEHSTKEPTVGAEGRVAAAGIKLVYLTQRADKGVSVFNLLSSKVHNASR